MASSTDLLEEWHDLVDYTATFFAPSSTSYRATWYKLFHSSLVTSRWSNIMLVVGLLFCLPVSNATVERFFDSLKRVKTGRRSTLGQKTTEDILTIMTEGPPLEEYDATEAVQSWHSSKSRRLNQKAQKSYKTRRSKKPRISETPSDSDSDESVDEQLTQALQQKAGIVDLLNTSVESSIFSDDEVNLEL